MFKIGEFSKLGQVSTHRLRRYDKLGLLKPSYIDKFTDYRYYTIDQLARLNRIIALSKLGFSLEQVGELLKDGENLSAEQLRGMLQLRRGEIERQLRAGREQLNDVEARLRQIENEGQPLPYEIVVKSVPEQTVASTYQVVPHVSEIEFYCTELFLAVYASLQEQEIQPVGPEVLLFHSEEYSEVDLEIEAAVPVSDKYLQAAMSDESIKFQKIPASELSASMIYEGPFDEVDPAVLALFEWVGAHQHTILGPVREVHHTDSEFFGREGQEEPVLEIQVPIQKSDLEES